MRQASCVLSQGTRPGHWIDTLRSYCSTSENPCDSGNVANVHTDKLANLFQTVGLDVMPTNQPTILTTRRYMYLIIPRVLYRRQMCYRGRIMICARGTQI